MDDLMTLTAGIVSAHVEHNRVASSELPALIAGVHSALSKLGEPEPEPETAKPKGAVSARKSLADPAHIISMIDGKAYKTLKRHITKHGYSPESYRETFGLPRDYPLVAPGYSEHRRSVAHTLGLGRKRVVQAVEEVVAPVAEAVKKRGRKAKEVAAPAIEAVAEPVQKAVRRGRKSAADALAIAREHLPG